MLGRFLAVITVGLVTGTGVFGAHPSSTGGFKPMGRLRTIGFEVLPPNVSTPKGALDIEGKGFGSAGQPDTTDVRSGLNSYQTFVSNFQAAFVWMQITTNANTTYFARAYFKFYNTPSAAMTVMTWVDQTNPTAQPVIGIKLTPSNTLQLWNILTNTQIGADSAPITADGSFGPWYRLELSFSHATASLDWGNVEARLNGVTIASGTATGVGNIGSNGIQLGFLDAIAVATLLEMRIDDVAINDNSGASQNSWPGEGKIVALKPISDNARGGWTGGAGGTTNLFDAVNNDPPVGVAVASETNTSQIKSLTNSATDNCDLNMTTYATAGLTATDTVSVLQTIINHGEGIITGTKLGAVTMVSNPAQGVEDALTFGGDAGPVGTFPSAWLTTWGTPQYSPSVTIGTSPVMRVGKRTATTREVDVDLMAVEVEYVQGLPVSALHPFMDSPNTNTLLRM